MRQMLILEISLYLLPRDRQEGTHHKTVAGTHRGKAGNARAPHQIQQQGLHTVVAVMRHGYRLGSVFPALRFEPVVAQLATSHLDREALFAGIALRIERYFIERYPECPSRLTGKIAVSQRFVASQIEIAMTGDTRIAQPRKHMQQRHRIGTATYPHYDGGRLVQQAVIGDKGLYLL